MGLKSIQMLYGQIVLHNGIPFDVRIPTLKPVASGALSNAELDAELMKGEKSLKNGKDYSADKVNAMLQTEFGI